MVGGMCGRWHAWWGGVGVCMAGGMCCRGGHAWQGGVCGRYYEIRYERAVRILVECILVAYNNRFHV